jgi:hypothetical protein
MRRSERGAQGANIRGHLLIGWALKGPHVNIWLMRKLVSMIAAASLALLLSACTTVDEPRNDASRTTGHIPPDLDGALLELDQIMGRKGRAEVMRIKEKGMIEYHHGLGTWLRNNWLRGESPLKEYFRQLGIHHRDDMSGIILDSYWRKLHNRPIDLEGQVRSYQNYWKNQETNGGG